MFRIQYGLMCVIFVANGVLGSNSLTNYLASNLDVKYTVLDNFALGPAAFKAEIVFTNTGDRNVTELTWSIYLCSSRMMEPDILVTAPDSGAPLGSSGLLAYHIEGCMFRIAPGEEFDGLAPDEMLILPFIATTWQVLRSDVFPNWYVEVQGEEEPTVLEVTADESLSFVSPFDNVEQWKRQPSDQYDPFTAEERFEIHGGISTVPLKLHEKGGKQNTPVHNVQLDRGLLPTPLEMNLDWDRTLWLQSGGWVVDSTHPDLYVVRNFLAGKLGLGERDIIPSSRYIFLDIDQVLPERSSNESYHVDIDTVGEAVVVTGPSAQGVFWGAQTVESLQTFTSRLPHGTVTDVPRYPHRGIHVDLARNFNIGFYTVNRLIDTMSMYKMNKLHLHLTDDEGWRLDIPGLPELTQIGGQRCHDLDETTCLMPQLGSGPKASAPGSGSLSVQEYKEIVRHAKERFIQVIPEVDLPGHANAAIKAMEARYRKYMEDDDEDAALEYLISDLNDTSRQLSLQLFRGNVVNPCMDSTYHFVDHVVKEIKEMHQDIQPLTIMHIGGDEVAAGSWRDSPECTNFTVDNEIIEGKEELEKYFVQRVATDILDPLGIELAGWEEAFMERGQEAVDREKFPGDSVYANAWNNIWELSGKNNAYIMANAGYKVILSHATHMYFDHPHEPDPEDRGSYWATRYIPEKKVFAYMPDSVYDNIDTNMMGNLLDKDELCEGIVRNCVPLDEEKRQNIIGIQGQLWGETVRGPDVLDAMIQPRLVALAERAWHKASWEDMPNKASRELLMEADWENFAIQIGGKELERLEGLGVRNNLHPPGARITPDGELYANSMFPGQSIYYSEDNGNNWFYYGGPIWVEDDKTFALRVESVYGTYWSRITHVQSPSSVGTGTPSSASTTTSCSFLTTVMCITSFIYLSEMNRRIF